MFGTIGHRGSWWRLRYKWMYYCSLCWFWV